MKNNHQPELQEFSRNRLVEQYPLSDIALVSMNKILEDLNLSREQKIRLIIEYNFAFALVHYCLGVNRKLGNLREMDYTFMLLQLASWYKVNSIERSVYWNS